MKALTLWRPWPYAFFRLGKLNKDIENRGWPPPRSIIGQRIVLHAGKTWDKDGAEFICDVVEEYADSIGKALDRRELLGKMREAFPAGQLCGTVRVGGYDRIDGLFHNIASPWAFGPCCWKVSDPFEFKQEGALPVRGFQGLWEVPDPEQGGGG